MRYLPFSVDNFFRKSKTENTVTRRNWLYYTNNKLYCTVCSCFGKNENIFTKGFSNFRRTAVRVKEHEGHLDHSQSVESYVAAATNRDVEVGIFKMEAVRRKQVLQNRKVVDVVIDVIKYLTQQGLAFRGKNNEAASDYDSGNNQGNFLELVKLMAKYNPELKYHLNKCEKMSMASKTKKRSMLILNKKAGITGKNENGSKRGRGGLVSFLSKTTISKILKIMKKMLIDQIVAEIKESGSKFGIECDTTQDSSGKDQASVVLRYITSYCNLNERVVAFKHSTCGTGKGMYNLIKSVLDELKLEMNNVVGFSFDGASNMRSENKGVNAFIKEASPNAVFTWCHSHRLNLAINDACGVSKESKLVEGLIQETANYIKDSYKRMDVWLNTIKTVKNYSELKRPQLYSSTRWWSKEKSLNHILNEPLDLYVLLKVLNTIVNSGSFDNKAVSGAKMLIKSWCNYRTVLSALLLKELFSYLKPPTDYLQTKGLDVHQALSIIATSQKQIKLFRNQYEEFKIRSDKYIGDVNILLKADDDTALVEIEKSFKSKAIHKVKRRDGEMVRDESTTCPDKKFEREVFNILVDELVGRIQERFLGKTITSVMKEISQIHPSNFKTMDKNQSFPELCKLARVKNKEKLRNELRNFVQFYNNLKLNRYKEEIDDSISSDMNSLDSSESDSDIETSDNENEDTESTGSDLNFADSTSCDGKCLNCLGCVLKILNKYNMHSKAYRRLFKIYKAIVLLPSTQVECERSFSKLKYIKNRLRSTLKQENLESLMILNCEKDLTRTLVNSKIIDKLGETSTLMNKLLI